MTAYAVIVVVVHLVHGSTCSMRFRLPGKLDGDNRFLEVLESPIPPGQISLTRHVSQDVTASAADRRDHALVLGDREPKRNLRAFAPHGHSRATDHLTPAISEGLADKRHGQMEPNFVQILRPPTSFKPCHPAATVFKPGVVPYRLDATLDQRIVGVRVLRRRICVVVHTPKVLHSVEFMDELQIVSRRSALPRRRPPQMDPQTPPALQHMLPLRGRRDGLAHGCQKRSHVIVGGDRSGIGFGCGSADDRMRGCLGTLGRRLLFANPRWRRQVFFALEVTDPARSFMFGFSPAAIGPPRPAKRRLIVQFQKETAVGMLDRAWRWAF
mmetsp:Transcript_70913/g.197037  ORF Transcript_70913/g.197037 Transcript_70913/m.197037 type:complete len:326 (-) Transcript_70913:251-1228(-)